MTLTDGLAGPSNPRAIPTAIYIYGPGAGTVSTKLPAPSTGSIPDATVSQSVALDNRRRRTNDSAPVAVMLNATWRSTTSYGPAVNVAAPIVGRVSRFTNKCCGQYSAAFSG